MLGKTLKQVSHKMHEFLKNAINFALLYSGFVRTDVQALYTQKLSCISFGLWGYIFLQDTGIEKPNKTAADDILIFWLNFSEYIRWHFMWIICFIWNVKSYFLWKSMTMLSAANLAFNPIYSPAGPGYVLPLQIV